MSQLSSGLYFLGNGTNLRDQFDGQGDTDW
jgi:hypothetical protein